MTTPLDLRIASFAGDVLDLLDRLPKKVKAHRLGDQLARCSTSIGANYEEATAAESHADFIHKMHTSLKEAREAAYWLRLADRRGGSQDSKMIPILQEAMEISAMLGQALVTVKFGRGKRTATSTSTESTKNEKHKT